MKYNTRKKIRQVRENINSSVEFLGEKPKRVIFNGSPITIRSSKRKMLSKFLGRWQFYRQNKFPTEINLMIEDNFRNEETALYRMMINSIEIISNSFGFGSFKASDWETWNRSPELVKYGNVYRERDVNNAIHNYGLAEWFSLGNKLERYSLNRKLSDLNIPEDLKILIVRKYMGEIVLWKYQEIKTMAVDNERIRMEKILLKEKTLLEQFNYYVEVGMKQYKC